MFTEDSMDTEPPSFRRGEDSMEAEPLSCVRVEGNMGAEPPSSKREEDSLDEDQAAVSELEGKKVGKGVEYRAGRASPK